MGYIAPTIRLLPDLRSEASRPIPFGNAAWNCPIGEDSTIRQEAALRFNVHAGGGRVNYVGTARTDHS